MKSYRRIMLGHKSVYAPACFAGGFIGIDVGFFVMTADHSNSNIGAGLACGFTWTLCKGLQIGDIVLSPDGSGVYRVGDVTGNYY